MSLLPHHVAWLTKHPDRSKEWLAERLLDGFHVHHLDGDHQNNAPANLILIDGDDHISTVHISRIPLSETAAAKRWATEPPYGLCALIYNLRCEGYSWREIDYHFGKAPSLPGSWSMRLAKFHADSASKPWPLRTAIYRAKGNYIPISDYSRLPANEGWSRLT